MGFSFPLLEDLSGGKQHAWTIFPEEAELTPILFHNGVVPFPLVGFEALIPDQESAAQHIVI